MLQHIHVSTTYQELQKDPTRVVRNDVISTLQYLYTTHEIEHQTIEYLNHQVLLANHYTIAFLKFINVTLHCALYCLHMTAQQRTSPSLSHILSNL